MVRGFRVERLIGAGSVGAVYEATQISLGRTVALRLVAAAHFSAPDELSRFDERQRLAASLHHPNLVPSYEFGEWEGGRFIAMRFVRGRSLSELLNDRAPITAGTVEPLTGALAVAHAARLAHGSIGASNVLVDISGTPYLADLGLREAGTPADDSRALSDLLRGLPDETTVTRTLNAPRPIRLAAAAIAAVAAVTVALLAGGGGDDAEAGAAPTAPTGTDSLGSTLAPGATEPFGCGGLPSQNTPACTVVQATVDGEEVVARRTGVVRSWAVRGASGELTLQVIRTRGENSYVAAFAQPERVIGPGPVAFASEVAVRAGDRIGVRLGPGAELGSRAAADSTAMAQWDGGLTGEPARPADTTTPGLELMLRADIEFGARADGPRLLVGRRAASAPAGIVLTATRAVLSEGKGGRVAIVELPGGIALDVFRGVRLARLEVPDADPAGDLLELTQNCGPVGARGFCLRWHNPGVDLPLEHEYRLRGNGMIELIG